MGRWTERLAAQTASGGCANSAISANSPFSEANGTNGTNGKVSPTPCEQVAFDEVAAALEYDHHQPRNVAEAVASLTVMPPPDGMAPERWRQLVEDAGRFASTRWAEAQAKGWSVLEIFGCSPGFARRLDRDGLVMLLYGRPVGSITPEYIEIVASGRDVLRFPRGKGVGATAIWNTSGGADEAR
jgi:hypothetical protein